MYVLLVVLMFANPKGPAYMSPPALPLFFSEEACKSVAEELTDSLKASTKANQIIYSCTKVIPVNTGEPA